MVSRKESDHVTSVNDQRMCDPSLGDAFNDIVINDIEIGR